VTIVQVLLDPTLGFLKLQPTKSMHSVGESGTEEENNSSLCILTVSGLPNVHWPPGGIWIDAGTPGVYMPLISRRIRSSGDHRRLCRPQVIEISLRPGFTSLQSFTFIITQPATPPVIELVAKMPSPVLEEIKTILVAVYPDTFCDPIDKCLGTTKSKAKCKRSPSGPAERKIAARRMGYFVSLSEVPHDERFYKEVEEFLEYSHCQAHQGPVFAKFEDWKTKRGDRATSTPTSPVLDEDLNGDQSGANPLVPNPVAQTPTKKTDGETTDKDEQDTNSDIFSSTTISPSQESENAFSTASPASTAPTTPAQTPFDEDPNSRRLDAFGDAESYPGTPSRVARKPSVSVIDPEAANNELADVIDQHSDQKQEVLGRISGRFNSVRRKTWPLLKAIENKFTDTDYKKGRVYIWTHQTIEGVVKIGFTAEGSSARHEQAGNCYAKNTKPLWESSEPFIGAYRVESIVHYNLRDENIELVSCSQCNRAHKEWFKIDSKKAVKLIEIWTQFVTIAYTDGRLSEQGEQIMNNLCNLQLGKLVDALPANIGPVQDEELTGLSMVSEESEADQQTSILEEQVSGLASDEQMAVTVNTAPSPPSTGQVLSDTTPDQSATLLPTGQVPIKENFKKKTNHLFNKVVGTMMKTHGRHPGRSDSSEQADGERRDGNEELFSKLLGLFYSAELREAEKMRNHNQSDAADARDEAQLKKKNLPWRLRNRSTAA
jgi:hypothetical protein